MNTSRRAACRSVRECARIPQRVSRLAAVASSSARQPKDPKDFGSMDELRETLHKESGYQLSIASLLNWVGDNAFGYKRQGFLGLGRLYRQVARLPAPQPSDSYRGDAVDAHLATLDQARVAQLMALMLCSRYTIGIISLKYPPIMTMQLRELGFRMIAIKTLLPGCDAARLVELQPRAFLGRDQQQVAAQVKAANRLLRTTLKGADVDRMIEEDPLILFTEVSSGIRNLRELWDVDEQALRNSAPVDLALAVRALSDSGPPKRF